jgi:nucleoside-diphosphate-sugar epimerase
MSPSAFLSGASGFVGSHLLRELHGQGWNVHVLARPTSSLDEIDTIPATIHIGDIVDAESIRAAMPDGIDAVFHVAASTNFWTRNNDTQTQINVDGTHNMIEAAVAAGAGRFIHTSSFVTWGFQEAVLTEETSRVDTSDWINYVRTKHLAEKLVLDSVKQGRLDAVILNPANVLGPGDWHNWSRLFRMIQRGSLPGAPPGGGSFCDVREVARAHVKAYHHAGSGEKYLLGGDYATMLEVISMAGDILGKRVPKKPMPAWMLKAWARVVTVMASITGKEPDLTPESAVMASQHIVCDSAKAQRQLGYQFTPVRTLIQDTVDWMHTKGLLQ